MDASVITDAAGMILFDLRENEVPDARFRVLFERVAQTLDVLTLSRKTTDAFTIGSPELSKRTACLTLRVTKVAGDGSFRPKKFGGLDAV